MEQLTQRDFRELALDEIAKRSGLPAPDDPTPEEEAAYRARAWNSYKIDVQNRDEWGTAMQSTEPPAGEEPEL